MEENKTTRKIATPHKAPSISLTWLAFLQSVSVGLKFIQSCALSASNLLQLHIAWCLSHSHVLFHSFSHGTFDDADPMMTPKVSYPVNHNHHNDQTKAKMKLQPNRVNISSHFNTISATLPTIQQPYPRQKKKIRRLSKHYNTSRKNMMLIYFTW
jgi:hypothetical protein